MRGVGAHQGALRRAARRRGDQARAYGRVHLDAVPLTVVRRANRGDLERIVELFRQLTLDSAREIDANDPAYARAFDEIVRDERQMVAVVELAGRVVGTATLSFLPNLSHGGRPVAQLESVVVDEAVRGQGAGEALVAWCIARARERDCFRVQLTSDLRRADAHRFWAKCGFTHTHAGFKQRL